MRRGGGASNRSCQRPKERTNFSRERARAAMYLPSFLLFEVRHREFGCLFTMETMQVEETFRENWAMIRTFFWEIWQFQRESVNLVSFVSSAKERCRQRWRACSGAPPLSRAEKTEPNVGKPGRDCRSKGGENRREETKELEESERPSDRLFAWPKMTMVAFRARPPMKWADK